MKWCYKKVTHIFFLILAWCAYQLPVLAGSTTTAGFVNPLKATTLQDFLLGILNAIIYIIFPILILAVVYTGFLFVAAQGNPTKLQNARRALLWTIVGAVVVLGAKALSLAISATVASLLP